MAIAEITPAQAAQLKAFLNGPARPEGTFGYCELAGFLFAIASAPDRVAPSDWLPVVFNDDEPGYANADEAQEIMQAIMALFNQTNEGVLVGRPELPEDCERRADAMANLDDDAPLGQWARGFWLGHEHVVELWDAHLREDQDEALDSCLLPLCFFGSRVIAESFRKEFAAKGTGLVVMAADMLSAIPNALKEYSALGRGAGKKNRPNGRNS